jgi:hypothetical protein
MANPSKKIREQRDDLSPFLFHYTKGREAFEILLSIIDEKKLKSEKGYICFTEAPLATSLRMFDYMNQYPDPMYAPYGIGFNRDFLFNIVQDLLFMGQKKRMKKSHRS